MILGDEDLREAIATGKIGVSPFHDSLIGPSSIDLHLGPTLVQYSSPIIKLGKTLPEFTEVPLDESTGYTLLPGGFVLGCTLERIYVSAFFQGWVETKGDVARAGIQVHSCDGHVDPGFHGTITLEISNRNTIPVVLFPRILICQLFVATLSTECRDPYHGKYLGQARPTVYMPPGQEKEDGCYV